MEAAKGSVVFDPLLHQSIRSKLVSMLISNDELPFKALKEALGVTDGNLSSHLSKLEKEKYITIDKVFEGKRPKTVVKIALEGRKAFEAYIEALKVFIEEN
ncbi:MAG: Transcriptional regulators, marR/emrR family [uncultured Sulfurovum sp.]|uniref:Transcriptional regulators, marR/emrR family n=1 Tax=uncultured Sulfurovum sp. TaxID=269237 RepID=A0A6S6U7S2_9BACT|nr:MAG: Transcriptional regulators, marR/emrR family [uncultured Sulfurovum sp.]